MTVFVLVEHGDDYHGTQVLGVYSTLVSAETAKATVQECVDKICVCNFRYSYEIKEMQVE